MRRSLRCESGFTLIELLVGMIIGLVVILAGFAVMDSTVKLTHTTQQRVDATQRARMAMELMTRDLKSQVCLAGDIPALTQANATSVTYYTQLGTVTANPEKHQISLENGDILLRRWTANGTAPDFTWTAQPTKTLLENVQLIGTTAFLRYYKWTAATIVVPTTEISPGVPLSTANLALPVKIALSYRALPARDMNNTKGSAELQDSVYVRSSDPTDTTKGPRCN